jgi:hypothetical protein
MATKLDNGEIQIVGVVDNKLKDSFEGLTTLRSNIENEFAKVTDKTKPYIYPQSVKVKKIMPGYVKTSKEVHNLKDITKDKVSKVIFGIMKNGVIDTNGALENYLISPIKGQSNKEGRLYMFIKGADGRYIPMLVKANRLNATTDFDSLMSIEFFRNAINNSVKALASARTEGELTAARNLLSNWLYIGNQHIDLIAADNTKPITEDNPAIAIKIRGDKTNVNGKLIYLSSKPTYKKIE